MTTLPIPARRPARRRGVTLIEAGPEALWPLIAAR